MIKQPLNGPGSATVQAQELNQSPTDLARSMTYLQSDFSGWTAERFDLSASQQEQIDTLPEDFKKTLSTAIANELLAGRTIAFTKEIPKEEWEDKDILIFSSHRNAYSFISASQDQSTGLQIVISYR